MSEETPVPQPEPKPDAYDSEDGYLVEVEDIAIVAYEACRAYDRTLGDHTAAPWMHAPKRVRDGMVAEIRGMIAHPGGSGGADPKARLVVAVVRALAVP